VVLQKGSIQFSLFLNGQYSFQITTLKNLSYDDKNDGVWAKK